MTPNLLIATQKVLSPHKWFRTSPKAERPKRRMEYWAEPIPGQYEYIPGRGWFLVAQLKDTPPKVDTSKDSAVVSVECLTPTEFVKLPKPIPVHRSQILKRYLLEEEYKKRKTQSWIRTEDGKRQLVGFFQLDDGIAWVQCWDENGEFIARSEYKRWCIDPDTGHFRHLRRSDDPEYILRSQNVSRERGSEDGRRSQQSASTGYQRGGGPSLPSTRANSIRGVAMGSAMLSNPTSTPSSRAQSRRSSPRRNNSIPLEEAKAALRMMAEEQKRAVSQAASAANQGERGRQIERVAR